MIADFFAKPLNGFKFQRFYAFVLGLPDVDNALAPTVCKECVVNNKDMGQLTTKAYVAPGHVDDEYEGATSWVNVVRRKRPSVPSSLVGKQSVAMLTLFTKPKLDN